MQTIKPLDRPPRSSLPPEWLAEEPGTDRTTEDNIPVAPPSRLKDRPLLTMLTGLNAGQVFPLDGAETTIGRAKDAHVRLDEAGISRNHARIVRTDDGRFVAEDLRSTNGLFVNGARVQKAVLGASDRIQVGPNVIFRFGLLDAEEEELARQLFESSTRDALTRAYNRKYLSERLGAEVAYAQRHATTLAVILLDLDHFKRVNDSHGHQAGDAVLRVVAAQIARLIRAEDIFARFGGEEFLVLVRGIEHANVARFAERIRMAVEQLLIPVGDLRLRASLSLGVATLGECHGGGVESLLSLADERLYKAKVGGRNRVAS
jgi:two-component system cell cycle response regulator